MNTALVVVGWTGWALGLAVPLLWWLGQRRRVDPWRLLPLPGALLDSAGRPVATTGPPAQLAGRDWALATGLPAPGALARGVTADGLPVAVAGVPGGAVAVALPPDPLVDTRDRLLADLAPRLAHEVTTPLTAVRGHLDIIRAEPLGRTALASWDHCVREVERLAALGQDLLTLTGVRAGSHPKSRELAGALAQEAVIGLLPLADQLRARLDCHVPAEPVLVEVVAGDLIRALRNLVHNALRYGLGERRQVAVRVQVQGPAVVFTVTDSGPGIAPQELARLVQPLERGGGLPEGETSGAGLGLAIVAEVLAAHGAALEVVGGPGLSFCLPVVRR
ncbi:MAG: sensor histidine kinase [Mycobacteriales bacterium]